VSAPVNSTTPLGLNPTARLGSWPQALFNDGRFERQSARLAAGSVGKCAVLIASLVRDDARRAAIVARDNQNEREAA
jgi:hypothetical protein